MVTEKEVNARIQENAQYDELTKFAKWHICAICDSPLVVRWWQETYEVKCGKNKAHSGFKSWRERKQERGG